MYSKKVLLEALMEVEKLLTESAEEAAQGCSVADWWQARHFWIWRGSKSAEYQALMRVRGPAKQARPCKRRRWSDPPASFA